MTGDEFEDVKIFNMVLHAVLQVMAFNVDHVDGNLWDAESNSVRDKANTYLTVGGVIGLVLPDLLKEARVHFGCLLNSYPTEAETVGDQFYWEKRYNFYDVTPPLSLRS
jgi:hypothetical protein